MANSVIGQAVKEKRRQANMTVRELAELVPAADRKRGRLIEATRKKIC